MITHNASYYTDYEVSKLSVQYWTFLGDLGIFHQAALKRFVIVGSRQSPKKNHNGF